MFDFNKQATQLIKAKFILVLFKQLKHNQPQTIYRPGTFYGDITPPTKCIFKAIIQ